MTSVKSIRKLCNPKPPKYKLDLSRYPLAPAKGHTWQETRHGVVDENKKTGERFLVLNNGKIRRLKPNHST